jgi:hypothetical protein
MESGKIVGMETSVPPIVALLRRYVCDYVNPHDFGILPDIMAQGYRLMTGDHEIAGRDGPYRSAVARQFSQFPGLVLTPHELLVSGNRAAIRFTEHGASAAHGGRQAAWRNIAIYEMAEGRLAQCRIEQDFASRRAQLSGLIEASIDPPAIAPWDTPHEEPCPAAEQVARQWLAHARWLETDSVRLDDSDITNCRPMLIAHQETEILALVSGTNRVAFHARQTGHLADPAPGFPDAPAWIHLSGILQIDDGRVAGGHVVRDREGLRRRLARALDAPRQEGAPAGTE